MASGVWVTSSGGVEEARWRAERVWRRQLARRWPPYSIRKAMKAPAMAIAVVVASYFSAPRHLWGVSV